LITEPVYSISRAIHTVSELTVSQQSKNKKLSYRKQIARKQCAHSNDRKFQGAGEFHGKRMWDTDGGGRCRKQKFQCGIVFDKEIVFRGHPVTPLMAAAIAAASRLM